MSEYPGYILITGAGGGLGLALTEYLLACGVRRLVCQYRNRGDELAALLATHGLPFGQHCFRAELTDEVLVAQMHTWADAQHGTLWGLINLAGGCPDNALSWRLSADQFQQALADNLLTAFLCAREFTPGLRAQGGGRIINATSVVAYAGAVGAAHYAAAKAGVVGLTKALALELAPKQVTVNALALGYFDRGLIQAVPEAARAEVVARTPLGRLGAAAQIGAVVAYLLSEAGGFVTGQALHLNGGYYFG